MDPTGKYGQKGKEKEGVYCWRKGCLKGVGTQPKKQTQQQAYQGERAMDLPNPSFPTPFPSIGKMVRKEIAAISLLFNETSFILSSYVKKGFRISFDDKWQPSYHHNYYVGDLAYPLVQTSGQIPKTPGQWIIGYYAHSYFVAHKN